MYYQQGDVLITKTEKIDLTKAKKLNHLIVAEGEATGHKHQIIDKDKASLYLLDEDIILIIDEETALIHEEHKEINLPPGQYYISFKREYDHFEEEAKKILD